MPSLITKTIASFFVACLLCIQTNAQPAMQWQRCAGGSKVDAGSVVTATPGMAVTWLQGLLAPLMAISQLIVVARIMH